jgi:outer membrane protein OmpA-like peptidoglycan-associated protein
MGYVSDSLGFGEFGCGAGCSCQSCQTATPNFSEVYEEEEPPPAPPVRPSTAPGMAGWFGRVPHGPARAFAASPPFGFARSFGGFGQAPLRTPWRSRLDNPPPPPRLRFLNLDQFNWNDASLTPRLLQMVRFLADHVRASWTSMRPIGFVLLVGHTDETGSEKVNVALGHRRAQAVKAALESVLKDDILSGRIRVAILVEPSPGESAPVADNRTSAGKAQNRRVEVFVEPPALPTPPIRKQSSVPFPPPVGPTTFRPETPEERINRILRTLPPAPLPRRSFNQMFWQRVDESLDSLMSRAGVPQRLRGPIRDGAHAAINRGAEAVFNQVLDAANLPGPVREALNKSVRAALETPVR